MTTMSGACWRASAIAASALAARPTTSQHIAVRSAAKASAISA